MTEPTDRDRALFFAAMDRLIEAHQVVAPRLMMAIGKQMIPVFATIRAEAKREAAQWQPIETAPRDAKFLAWNGAQVFIGEYLHGKFFTSRGLDGRSSPPPTHWMPLPMPPAE